MTARGKMYDAIVTVRVRVPSMCDDYDMSEGDTFEEITKMVFEEEGICGLLYGDDEPEIVSIDQVEAKESEK